MGRRWPAMALSVALIAACGGADLADPNGFQPANSTAASSSASETAPPEVELEPWGHQAEAWWAAMGEAALEGVEHLAPFLASDLLWEDRVFDLMLRTEDDWLDLQLGENGGTYPWIDAAMLVSADEVLGSFRTPMPGEVDSLDRMVIGPDGVRHWVTGLGPLEVCRANAPWMCEFDADGLVDRYLIFWGGAGAWEVEVGSIYAPYAVVTDSLLGSKFSGAEAIAEAAGSTRSPSTELSVPTISKWGRAVYLAPRYYDWVEGPEEIRFLVDADDGSGCPGRMGVALAFEGERVIWEHRYHDIESVRRCYDPAELESGWWEDLATPDTMVVEQTGTVSYGDGSIEVFNGIPELDDFVRWGFSRFEAAGLNLPRIDALTFIRARVYCRDVAGRAHISTQETGIVLCFTPAEICADDACTQWTERSRHYWLHELAHPWLAEFTDEAVRSEFLDLVELPKWSDLDDPWRQRGVERAADVLAHSLMDETVTLHPQIHESCLMRDSGFEILTGSVPLSACLDASE